jgi:hypothetical protein
MNNSNFNAQLYAMMQVWLINSSSSNSNNLTGEQSYRWKSDKNWRISSPTQSISLLLSRATQMGN